jgi:hypothetical protein
VDLPSTIRKGQEFNIVVSRITSRRFPREIINAGPTPKSSGSRAATRQSSAKDVLVTLKNWRYVVGNFQVRIPVTTKEVMLLPEENTLAIMKWRLESLPASDRWYPVLQRYIGYIGARVDGLGGNANEIPASPDGAPIVVKAGLRDIVTYKGKVCEVIYDCFGDFEGFALEHCCAGRTYFKSRQHAIGELVLRLCKERLPIAVRIEKTDPPKIISIVVEC